MGGTALLLGGSLALLGLAWQRLLPSAAPPWPVLTAAALVVGLVEFSLAATIRISPSRPPDWWRPVALGLVLCGAAAVGATAPRHHLYGGLAAVLLLALAARAAETLGAHLAPAVRLYGEYRGGDWGRQGPETRRIVLETWVVSALGATRLHGWGATGLLAAMTAGGLVLVAGARMDSAERLSADGGFHWGSADRMRAWRGVAAVSALIILVASLVPALPPIFSRRFFDLPMQFLHWLLAPGHAQTNQGVPPPSAASHPSAPLTSASTGTLPSRPLPAVHNAPAAAHGALAVLAALAHGANAVLGAVLLRLLAPLMIPAVIVVLILAYLRNRLGGGGGGWSVFWQRLWESLAALLQFWKWFERWQGVGEEHLAEDEKEVGRHGVGDGGAPAGGPGLLAGLMDPRRIVRAAYRRFLRAAAGSGYRREPAESPDAYQRRLGPILDVQADEAQSLTRAYEEARYSDHPVDQSLAQLARQALQRLLRNLSGFGARIWGR